MKNLILKFLFFIFFIFNKLEAEHLIKSEKFESFYVETATTVDEKSRGLMNVENLENSNGMIFIYDLPTIVNFWMYKTSLNLDIIFIDHNKKILSIKHGKPFSTKIISSEKPVIAVLEIPFNCSHKIGLTIGMSIEWVPFKSVNNNKKRNLCKKL